MISIIDGNEFVLLTNHQTISLNAMAYVTPTLAPQWRNYILLEIDAKINLRAL